ncbi:MAG: phage protease [Puniceicoccales bacterium]|jgi:hypothetical protein|nr:phage protease [Puniceicoccales bacterium]
MEINQWLKLVEYGDHPHPEGIQRVTRIAAEEMQRKFRSLRARLARKFGGIPIYIGHPDDKDFSFLPGHSDTRSYAWVQDIEARDDGIWILPKWSEAGRAMIENSFFKFLSPRWEMKQEGGVLVPVRLISVGLTNNPNILGDAIANQKNTTVTPKNINSRRGNAITERGNSNAAAAAEALAGANISDDAIVSQTDTVADPTNPATLSKNPSASAENEEVNAQITEKKKGKYPKKLTPKIKQNETQQNENFPLQQQLNNLLMSLFDVDFTKTWEEIETLLTTKANHARLWIEEGESLKNNNLDLLSESERFYKIACEKELQVQNLSEQLNITKNLSGEHFVNFAINRGLILPNEANAWKEKYAANPYGASNDLLKQTCLLNTTSKTEHLRQFPSTSSGKDQILALVNERMETSGESYAEAWNAIKKIYPTLF